MKQIYWKCRKAFNQIAVLLIIGYSLFWVYRHLSALYSLFPPLWIKPLFFICLLLYTILVVSTFKALVASNILQTYDPADPQSLAKLQLEKKYQLKLSATIPETITQDLEQWLYQQGYQKVALHRLGLLFEKKTSFLTRTGKSKYHRTFLLYRPLLNVLVVDTILSEITSFIHQYAQVKPVSRNDLILLTDMRNEEEILSAGTGVVNYVCSRSSGNLYPVFLDITHKHLFYPQDMTLFPWYKRIARKYYLRQIKTVFEKSVKTASAD